MNTLFNNVTTTPTTGTMTARWSRPPKPITPTFKGPGITTHDQHRLTGHLRRVMAVMQDGDWRLLRTIADAVGCSEASASARLRDLRRPENGGHEVQRRRLGGGLHEYRVGGLPGANPGADGGGRR